VSQYETRELILKAKAELPDGDWEDLFDHFKLTRPDVIRDSYSLLYRRMRKEGIDLPPPPGKGHRSPKNRGNKPTNGVKKMAKIIEQVEAFTPEQTGAASIMTPADREALNFLCNNLDAVRNLVAQKTTPAPEFVGKNDARMDFRLPEAMKSAMLERAEQEGINVNVKLRELIADYLKGAQPIN
jgi:hypothetical protein